MTVADIINQALRKIGIVGHGQEANGEQARAALDAFNLMCHAWRLEGIDIWAVGAGIGNPTSGLDANDFDAASPFVAPAAFREGAVYCLAARIAPEYMVQVQFNERDYLRKMRAHMLTIDSVQLDPLLRQSRFVRGYSL